ncbi:TipJ family phage tail tip protein [Azospirillum palustre]|uniref:TipJ family phage tail tip protein n=1 Tax=Azospirillum palustre TaxID=2044885 RepID=UPI001FCE9053|nr:phage tail protein [Azospirillum palustre]
MARIHLHGALGRQFGRLADYQVRDAAEAIRALAANHPDFEKIFREGSYRLVRGPRSRGGIDLTLDTLTLGLGSADLHIIPVPAGAKSGGAGKAIMGALVMVVAIAAAQPWAAASFSAAMSAPAVAGISYGSIALFGAAMMLSGISQMLSPTPKANLPDSKQSYLFSGPVNVTEQGGSVPLVYGRCWVGSTVISSGMDTEQVGTVQPQPAASVVAAASAGGPAGGIQGAKGGKSGRGGSGATEDANSLQSNATARVIDLLGEGEIVGLVNEGRGIYFDGTPLIASDGTENFKGVSWKLLNGLPSQNAVEGFTDSETSVAVGVEVKKTSPVVRTIHSDEIDTARIVLRWNALTEQDTSSGDLHGSSVELTIEGRAANGSWTHLLGDTVSGKTTSAYERSYKVGLRRLGKAPYDIRVTRVTPDATRASVQNSFSWSHYGEIVEAKFGFDNSALVALTVKAEQFGNSIPERAYDVKGLKIRVPSNYDPETRSYTGQWDGSLKTAWSDNPAWVLYDLLTNRRYGLGQSISAEAVDRWSLYTIGVYCDQPVKSGRLDASSRDIMEPRFTFNGVISGRTEAYRVLQSIASTFRGLIFWSAGGVLARADMPADPIKLVTPANVIGGSFTYSGTALKARHTAALITFNDPEDGYRPTVEVVENAGMIQRYGWRPIEATAYGCTRRSQARRFGLWMLDSEQHETETVTYRCSFDHLDVMPGDVVKLADPNWALVRTGGRLVGYDPERQVVTLDDTVTLEANQSHVLALTLPDGRLVDCPVRRPVLEDHTTGQLVIDAAPLGGAVPQPHAVWILTATNLAPRLFRVRAVTEKSPGVYEVTALLHEPGKYARVEEGVQIEPVATQSAANAIPSPANLAAVESAYWVNGLPQARLTVSWTPSDDARISGYRADVMTPGGQWQEWKVTRAGSFDIEPAAEGVYTLRITAFAYDNRRSTPAEIRATVRGKGTPPGQPAGLVAKGGLRQIALSWVNPPDTDLSHIEVLEGAANDLSAAAVISTVKGNAFVRAGLGGLVTRYYWVRAVDLGGNVSDVNSNIGTGATTEQISHDDLADKLVSESKLVPILAERITGIEKIAETVTSGLVRVNDSYGRIRSEIGKREADVTEVKADVKQVRDDTQSLASRVTTVAAQFDGQIATVKEELTALVTADEATATRIDTVVAAWDGNLAGVQAKLTATANDARTNAERIDSVVAGYDKSLAGYDSRITANATATGALTTRLDVIGASVDGVKAGLTSEQTARADAVGALASRIDSAFVEIKDASGSFQESVNLAVKDAKSAVDKVTLLSSTVGDHTSSIKQVSKVTDGLSGQWTVKIDNNGAVSGFGLSSDPADESGVRSEFYVRADRFLIGITGLGGSIDHPFVIGKVDGVSRISMSAAFIQDASINSAKIRDATISSAHIQDLTIRGQKIEDFATGNMTGITSPVYFQEGPSISIATTGKPVALIATVSGVPGRSGGGENATWDPGFDARARALVIGTAPGVNTYRACDILATYLPPNGQVECTIIAIELRK